MRVVVIGSECTGKTTLARALAERYDTVWVPEFAREFVERKGAPPTAADVEAIARGQIAAEDALTPGARGLLVLDTDLMSTLVYARHYYGGAPEWVADAARERAGDLYLLTGIDVPWVADGAQRDRSDRRQAMHDLFRDHLTGAALPFVALEGPHRRRLARAHRAIAPLIVGECA